ncbi:hypothetical protein BIFGAL_03695 [Bifidobacterium gallicum DSM 20093 = LMG 11596]|uniref:Uncharacterized protein n=1 Tax=Bifidobacterium gallicum DSM 20093 = LMG 11596 TaxID=561180 RepID=D1NV17_9BIFI|nr:hypothetical protein BIFGAL_03695 [Bifidobacterium gallicum DSM 20093 = LMG 11596]
MKEEGWCGKADVADSSGGDREGWVERALGWGGQEELRGVIVFDTPG